MKIRIKIKEPVLITTPENGVLINVSHTEFNKSKGNLYREVDDTELNRRLIMQRSKECEFIGIVEETTVEINPETGKPYTKKELKEKAEKEAAGGTNETV